MLFGVENVPVNEFRVCFLYLPKRSLALEAVILYGKQVAFVNISLFDNGAAFSDLPVLAGDFFLGAYPFARFIKEYASGCNLHIWFGKQFPFAENQVDVVVGLAIVVVERWTIVNKVDK